MNQKIAYCGLACCVCSERLNCPGCQAGGCDRHGWCKNYNCCRERALAGCWECPDFPCQGGMLDKLRIRAFARFAQAYGPDELARCLLKNQADGVVYHHEGQLTGDYDRGQTEDEIFAMIIDGHAGRDRQLKIDRFSDFCEVLLASGFSMGGGNAKGIYAVIPYGWEDQDHIDSPVKWHTGDPETDPWEWRMRVLEERKDIAYAKLFFRASGYITDVWYPYFLAARRKGDSFADAYAQGTVSNMAKRIYEIIAANGATPYHAIKQIGAFSKADNAAFERAIVDLQMRMFITMGGRAQRTNQYGQPYGWNSTVFSTIEAFWQQRGVRLAEIDPDEAYEKIRQQIINLNPAATEKKIRSFICG